MVIDLSTEDDIPAAVNNAGSVETGWSIGPPCGIAPSLLSRVGANVLAGYLQFAPGQSACRQVVVPNDWDQTTYPYVRVNYTQNGSRSGEIIAFLIQTACSTTTDDPSYKSAQSFAVTTTSSSANVPYSATLQLDSTSMSGCAVGRVMNLKNSIGPNRECDFESSDAYNNLAPQSGSSGELSWSAIPRRPAATHDRCRLTTAIPWTSPSWNDMAWNSSRLTSLCAPEWRTRMGESCAATSVVGKSNVCSPGCITFAVSSFAGNTTYPISSGWLQLACAIILLRQL